MIYSTKGLVLFLSLGFLWALSACANPEGKGQALYETAQFEEQQSNFKHAKQLYREILRDYPESSFASKAKERLDALEKAFPLKNRNTDPTSSFAPLNGVDNLKTALYPGARHRIAENS
ncbi:MAG: tol-pal system YbgF family protein [Nitrospiria bacterium]